MVANLCSLQTVTLRPRPRRRSRRRSFLALREEATAAVETGFPTAGGDWEANPAGFPTTGENWGDAAQPTSNWDAAPAPTGEWAAEGAKEGTQW